MKTKVMPIDDRILVKPDAKKEETEGGIIIPETAQSKPKMGIVVAAGPLSTEVKEGDRIMFGTHAGAPVEIEGEEYLIMKADEAMAKIEEEGV